MSWNVANEVINQLTLNADIKNKMKATVYMTCKHHITLPGSPDEKTNQK